MKNTVKAVVYIILGLGACVASIFGTVYMWLSSTFLPVYVGKNYVIGNQIVRYILYVILFAVIILAVKLTRYGVKFLIKKLHKNKGR